MITAEPGAEVLDPLASDTLHRRFPELPTAMDGEAMQQHLQGLLFDDSWRIETCDRPRAELGADSCSLQYTLLVRGPDGEARRVIVLGTLFARSGAAEAFAASVLRPLATASRAAPPPWRATALSPVLHLALSVFPVVASLPSLAEAFDPASMQAQLAALLQREVGVPDIELVVLRRTRGCVLRYRLEAGAAMVLYGKAGYTAAPATAVLTALAQLGQGGAAAGGGPSIGFPAVAGHLPALELSLVHEAPGVRADLRRDSEVSRLVSVAGAAAATIHASRVTVGQARALQDELRRAREAVAMVARYAPGLASWLAEALPDAPADASQRVFSHGDFTPSQLLLDGPRATVLDFDKLCRAEPELDLGRFLAYLRFSLGKHGNPDFAGHATRLVGAYEAMSGRAVDSARLEAYETASLVRMAARSWLQLKPQRLRVVIGALRARVA